MNNNILIELLNKQLKHIDITKKLSYNDLKRISNNVSTSLFDTECCLWKGYITTINKYDEDAKEHAYINFFYNKKKFSLHRLLYINYIGELDKSEYIKFSCENKGKCCNINHFYKANQDNQNNQDKQDYQDNQNNQNNQDNKNKQNNKDKQDNQHNQDNQDKQNNQDNQNNQNNKDKQIIQKKINNKNIIVGFN